MQYTINRYGFYFGRDNLTVDFDWRDMLTIPSITLRPIRVWGLGFYIRIGSW